MKKISLLLLLPLAMLFSCAPEAKKALPSIPAGSYTAILNPETSTLTKDDSTEPISVNLKSEENKNVTYSLELGNPFYLHASEPEFVLVGNAYIKSISTYKVDRLIVDFFGKKGTFFDVYASNDGSGNKIDYHESTVKPYDEEGGGKVYEYPIDSTGWMIKNGTTDRKPAFYSITIVFTVE